MKIVINTPSSHIGKVVTDKLLEAKENVVIISRHPEKVTDFVQRGAQLVEGSIDDLEVLNQALKGADVLFWLTPPNFFSPNFIEWATSIAQNAAKAVMDNGVKRVVLISSVGAQNGLGAGPVGALGVVEKVFKDAVPNVTSIRAGFFMENYLNYIGMIAHGGTIYGPSLEAKKVPMVATYDIGMKASEILLDDHWSGFRTVGVHGTEDLNQLEAADIISEGIGTPVKYVEVTVDQAKEGMINSGMPKAAADLLG